MSAAPAATTSERQSYSKKKNKLQQSQVFLYCSQQIYFEFCTVDHLFWISAAFFLSWVKLVARFKENGEGIQREWGQGYI